jgi:hypothetical protein
MGVSGESVWIVIAATPVEEEGQETGEKETRERGCLPREVE